jgi:hypothetical protein
MGLGVLLGIEIAAAEMTVISSGTSFVELYTSVGGFAVFLLALAWCSFDAREKDFYIGRLNRWLLVLFFALGFPLYLFRTRGYAAFATIVAAILVVVGLFAVFAVTGLVTASVISFFTAG